MGPPPAPALAPPLQCGSLSLLGGPPLPAPPSHSAAPHPAQPLLTFLSASAPPPSVPMLMPGLRRSLLGQETLSCLLCEGSAHSLGSATSVMPAAWRRWGWQGLVSSLHGSSHEKGLLFFYNPVPVPPPRLAPLCSLDGNTWNEPFYHARSFPSASPLQTPGCSLRLLQGSSATSTPGLRMVATHGEAGLPHTCERKHLRPRECRSWIGPHLDLAPGTRAPAGRTRSPRE